MTLIDPLLCHHIGGVMVDPAMDAPTMTSPETGAPLKRGVRPFTVTYKGQSITVDLLGWYPEGEGDGVLVGDDMAAADQALRELKDGSAASRHHFVSRWLTPKT